jgi:hypothetical protein
MDECVQHQLTSPSISIFAAIIDILQPGNQTSSRLVYPPAPDRSSSTPNLLCLIARRPRHKHAILSENRAHSVLLCTNSKAPRAAERSLALNASSSGTEIHFRAASSLSSRVLLTLNPTASHFCPFATPTNPLRIHSTLTHADQLHSSPYRFPAHGSIVDTRLGPLKTGILGRNGTGLRVLGGWINSLVSRRMPGRNAHS